VAKTARKSLGSKSAALGILALSGVLGLVAATQTWLSVTLPDGVAAVTSIAITGQKLNSPLSPVAIALLASALALTIAGPVFRRVLAAVVILLGAGLGLIGVLALTQSQDAVAPAVAEVSGILGDAQRDLISEVSVTAWPAVTIAAGIAALGAGILALLRSGRWRSGGRKYEASAPAAGPSGEVTATDTAKSDRIADWDAMNSGQDPTDH